MLKIEFHHSAKVLKYVSRKNGGAEPLQDYNGKYGHGYTRDVCNFSSTRYSYREYWILERTQEEETEENLKGLLKFCTADNQLPDLANYIVSEYILLLSQGKLKEKL